MDFYFENRFLKINPYWLIFLKILTEGFLILIFLFSISFLFLKESGILRIFSLILLLLITVIFFLKEKSKKKITFFFRNRINLSEYLSYSCLIFFIETICRFKILKLKNFYIFIFLRFLREKKIQKIISDLGIDYFDVLKEVLSVKEIDQRDYLPILASAFKIAKRVKYPRINIFFLFCGLIDCGGFEINKILEKFDIKKEEILAVSIRTVFSKEIYEFKFFWFLSNIFLKLEYLKILLSLKPFIDKNFNLRSLKFVLRSFNFLNFPFKKNNLLFLSYSSLFIRELFRILSKKENAFLIFKERLFQNYAIYQFLWLVNNRMVLKEFLNYKIIKIDLDYFLKNYSDDFDYLLKVFFLKISKKRNIFLYISLEKNVLLRNKSKIGRCFKKILLFLRSPLIISCLDEDSFFLKENENLFGGFKKIKKLHLTSREFLHFLIFKTLLLKTKFKIDFSIKNLFLIYNFSKDFLKNNQFIKFSNNLFKEIILLNKKNKDFSVNRELVLEILASKIRFLLKKRISLEKRKTLSFKNLIATQIVNQKEALDEIAYKLGNFFLKTSNKIGFYLFIGPKGVGKTETAKRLANIFYGGQNRFLFFDMKYFQKNKDEDKIINFLKLNPSSLIFIKNIELSPFGFLDSLKNLLEQSFLKDDFGLKIDISKSLIIASSSLFSNFIKESFEKDLTKDNFKSEIKKRLAYSLPLWLINRFNDIIIFKPLEIDHLREIRDKKLESLNIDFFLKYGIVFELSEAAKRDILNSSIDSVEGAKIMVDRINNELKSLILEFISKGKISRGQKIYIDFDKNFILKVDS